MSRERDTPPAPQGIGQDPWRDLTRLTPARIALGRSGSSLPTAEVLRFGLAHAQARDAVHLPADTGEIVRIVRAQGLEPLEVTSRASDRSQYLRRPDLGRRLSSDSLAALRSLGSAPSDLALVIGDGLSAAALHANIEPLLSTLKPLLDAGGYALAPVAIATHARVALADEIGQTLRARAVLMLVGERPGLSSPDSLGAYLTFDPRVGRSDAERNCVSNIRAAGLSHAKAARKLVWLLREALRLELSGVALKDNSDIGLLE